MVQAVDRVVLMRAYSSRGQPLQENSFGEWPAIEINSQTAALLCSVATNATGVARRWVIKI